MTKHRRLQPKPNKKEALVYRTAVVRGAASGAIRALITWILER